MAISMDKMLLDEDTNFHPRWDEYDNRKIPTQLDSQDWPNLTSNGQFFKPNFDCANEEIPLT